MSCKNDKQGTLEFTTASCSSFLSVLPCKTLRDGKAFSLSVNSNIRKREKKSISREVSSTVQSFSPSPSKCLSYFPWHKHLDFSKSWCQGFSWRKSCIYRAGKEGGLPQQPFSMWPLCCSAAQARTLQELLVPAETLQRGGDRDIFSSQGCSSTPDWLPRLRSSSFPSPGPEVVTQGHWLFNIPTMGGSSQTNENWGGGSAGNINKPGCSCFLNAAFRFSLKARFE